MARTRDPLSARYDTGARRLLDKAVRRPRQWVSARIPSPPGDQVDAGGRTRHERAFTRALYYDRRVYARSPSREWALKVQWLDLSATGRQVRIRVHPASEGFLYAEARPGRSYIERPELQQLGSR